MFDTVKEAEGQTAHGSSRRVLHSSVNTIMTQRAVVAM
jgi:hypothetical protein